MLLISCTTCLTCFQVLPLRGLHRAPPTRAPSHVPTWPSVAHASIDLTAHPATQNVGALLTSLTCFTRRRTYVFLRRRVSTAPLRAPATMPTAVRSASMLGKSGTWIRLVLRSAKLQVESKNLARKAESREGRITLRHAPQAHAVEVPIGGLDGETFWSASRTAWSGT